VAHTAPAYDVVVRSTFRVFVLFGLALPGLEVLFFKALVECCPRGLAGHAGPVELVRDHWSADAVRLREFCDLFGDGSETQFQNRRELPYLACGEQEFSRNVVAVCGERPCSPGVPIVNHDRR
jgi:hypothetical protein